MEHEFITQAKALIESEMDITLHAEVEEVIDAALAVWRLDPDVDGVVGLVLPDGRQAIIVVYLERQDWEMDEQLLHNLLLEARF